jgi:hypothetical protein
MNILNSILGEEVSAGEASLLVGGVAVLVCIIVGVWLIALNCGAGSCI